MLFKYQAHGVPISQSFKISKSQRHQAKMILVALEALDDVIGDGTLPIITLQLGIPTNEFGQVLEGKTNWTRQPRACTSIEIYQNTLISGISTLHEIGHRLDIDALEFCSEIPNPFSKAWQAFIPWRAEVKKSLTIRTLRTFVEQSQDSQYVAELLRPREVFARSFAQYVVLRSQNDQLMAELRSLQNVDLPNRVYSLLQWTDEDFVAISQAFDSAFLRLGWMKPK
jgi:hypothetical protein